MYWVREALKPYLGKRVDVRWRGAGENEPRRYRGRLEDVDESSLQLRLRMSMDHTMPLLLPLLAHGGGTEEILFDGHVLVHNSDGPLYAQRDLTDEELAQMQNRFYITNAREPNAP